MRIPLPDGQWAEIADVVTHGREKAIARAGFAGNVDPTKIPEISTAIVSAFLIEWNVRGEDGKELPVTPDGIDSAPDAVVDQVIAAITELRKAASPPPNAKAAAS